MYFSLASYLPNSSLGLYSVSKGNLNYISWIHAKYSHISRKAKMVFLAEFSLYVLLRPLEIISVSPGRISCFCTRVSLTHTVSLGPSSVCLLALILAPAFFQWQLLCFPLRYIPNKSRVCILTRSVYHQSLLIPQGFI